MGFENVITGATSPAQGAPEGIATEVETRLRALANPEALKVAEDQRWADKADFERWRNALKSWDAHRDSFALRLAANAVGWKPTC